MKNEIEVIGSIPPGTVKQTAGYQEMEVLYRVGDGKSDVMDCRETGYSMTALESGIITGIKVRYENHLEEEEKERQKRLEESKMRSKRIRQERYMNSFIEREAKRKHRKADNEADHEDNSGSFSMIDLIAAIAFVIIAIVSWL